MCQSKYNQMVIKMKDEEETAVFTGINSKNHIFGVQETK